MTNLKVSRRVLLAGASAAVASNILPIVRPASAAREDNVELMRKLYAQLASILKVEDNTINPNKTLLILASPGLFVDPKLDLSKSADMGHLLIPY